METLAITEARLQAEIEALRSQYPETLDLYREVCVLLFFRHGITPTANKLYQLVRKGSMSAPAEALNRFWEALREKSRVRIEHPDLPESLRDSAGEMIGLLWQRAQASAQDALQQFREEAHATTVAAEAATQVALQQAELANGALAAANAELLSLAEKLAAAQVALAHAQGEVSALQRQVDTGASQRRELQESINTAQQRFTRELEQQRAAAVASEERHAADMRRILLDVDRERGNVTKLQKELEQTRRTLADQMDQLRQQLSEGQQQTDQLRQKNGELEGIIAELRGQRDRLTHDIEGLRQRLENLSASKAAPVRRLKPTSKASLLPTKTTK